MTFAPKYPAKFAVGDRAIVLLGGYRNSIVKVIEVRLGWPYANYTIAHPTDGAMVLNERELGRLKEGIYGTSDNRPVGNAARTTRCECPPEGTEDESTDREGEAGA